MAEPTDLQLIERYTKLRDFVADAKKKHLAQTKPYTDGLETIEQALMARLIERGADNTKTDAGTAYKVTLLNVKVTDREKFLEYALNGGDDMLLASAQKDAVRDYIDQHQAPPPGVEVTYFTNVNVRKN